MLPVWRVEFCIGLVIVALAAALTLFLRRQQKRYSRKRINVMRRIDTMSGADFELFLADYFRNQGYCVEVTQATGDFGADLILKKGRKRIVVQAKRWAGRVGVSSVQEVIAARHYYRANEALLITNSTLTRNAQKLAHVTAVRVWARQCLLEKWG